MKEIIYQINSFNDLENIPANGYFTFPAAALKYYGLQYIVTGLEQLKNGYDRFILTANQQYAVLFEITHTKINKVILDKDAAENLKKLLKEHKIDFFYLDNINIKTYDISSFPN